MTFRSSDDNLSSVGDDYLKVGADFLELGHLKLGDIKIDEAFTSLGTDMLKVGSDFHQVSDLFLKIALDLGQSGELPTESLSLDFSRSCSRMRTTSSSSTSALQTLELDLKLVGDDYAKLGDAFHDVFHRNGRPVITDMLGQVLDLAHHFSLL